MGCGARRVRLAERVPGRLLQPEHSGTRPRRGIQHPGQRLAGQRERGQSDQHRGRVRQHRPRVPGFFETFSPQRLFTAISSNIVDVSFFVPGTSFAALTRGFGVVFTDVDLANTTSLSVFDVTNTLLGTFFAPAITGDETFSFLGVDFGSAVVSRVRITTGTEALAAGNVDQDLNRDVVAMDDFIYGEPIRAIPEPETYALMLVGLAALAAARRRRGGQVGRKD